MIDVKLIFFISYLYLSALEGYSISYKTMWRLIHAEFSPSLLTEPKEALDRGHIKIKKPTIDSSPCPSAVDLQMSEGWHALRGGGLQGVDVMKDVTLWRQWRMLLAAPGKICRLNLQVKNINLTSSD